MQENGLKYYSQKSYSDELQKFSRIIENDINKLSKESIKSTGYIIDTLEASLWCFINSKSYEDAVITAANLGEDTDTIGSITGGLAGIYYGFESIPKKWIDGLVRKNDIIKLTEEFYKKLCDKNKISKNYNSIKYF
jgi:ADP-ribosyl-[dinitrogen reductase] hydrolase